MSATAFLKNKVVRGLCAELYIHHSHRLNSLHPVKTDIKEVANEIQKSDDNYSNSLFQDAFSNHKYLIRIANKNFKEKLKQNDPAAVKLNKEFEKFKQKKGNLVYKDALFDILSKMYATPNFRKWDDVDKNLIKNLESADVNAISRYKKLTTRHKEDFENYIFSQFLVDKQIKENNNITRKDIFDKKAKIFGP